MISSKSIAFILLRLLYMCADVCSEANLKLVYGLCNDASFADQGYETTVVEVFQDVKVNMPSSGYSYYDHIPIDNQNTDFFYGHGACNRAITKSECVNCLIAMTNWVRKECPWRYRAQYQLADCRLRYEFYPFQDN
ncbi:hypothetical protein NL676_030077 [Syzygium grande]|nr:hypothetical protein NL676_030077 [Syzygium grande]